MTKEQKVQAITAQIFHASIDTFLDEKFKAEIRNSLETIREVHPEFENVGCSVFTEDITKKKWKNKQHFFKVFYAEVDYLKESVGLSDNAEFLLYKMGKALKWEMNILVDDNDYPMNQKSLCEFLKIPIRTFSRNSKELIEKKLLLPVFLGKEVFYFINPHIMYVGTSINEQIPNLFEVIGYVCRKNSDNQRKTVEKRGKI